MLSIPEQIKILYIEDDTDSAVITLEYLKQATISKFIVTHMCTLKEGLEYLQSECRLEEECEIDVILLDLILPNSKGINTYKAVVDKCPFIPVVIISNHQEMAIECVKLGAQDYLFKPDYNGGTLTRSLTYAVQRDYLRKKYERERDVSKMYLDIAGVMLLVLDADGNVTKINKKGYEILGYKEHELVGSNWFDTCIPERMREEIKDVFSKVIIGDLEAVEFYSNPIVSKDGTEKYISWHNSLIHDNDRKITGVLSSGEDITEQREAQEKLKASEKQFRGLVEFTKAGMYKIDFIQNKFCYVNDVLCKQLGYTREELLAKGPYDVITEESINKWFERWEALQRGEFIENSFEYEVIRKDGSIAWALITAEYIEDKNKNIIGAHVVAIDISDRKIAQLEAKHKEEIIFGELEKRIHQWKDEMVEVSKVHRNTIQSVDTNLRLITTVPDTEVI